MIIPISEEAFNKVAKYSNRIVEFINILNNDKDVIKAIMSIPNINAFLDGHNYSFILKAMSIQDILTSFENIFGGLNPYASGFEGVYIYMSQILGLEYSYMTYVKIVTYEIECDLYNELYFYKNWGINASNDEYKIAILLSKIDDEKLKKFWKSIYQFLYCVINEGNQIFCLDFSKTQQQYLENIEKRAQNYFEDSTIFFKPAISKNDDDYINCPNSPYLSFKKENNSIIYKLQKDKIISYSIKELTSDRNQKSQTLAKFLYIYRKDLDIEVIYTHPKYSFRKDLIFSKKEIIDGETIFVCRCKYTGSSNMMLRETDFPTVPIKALQKGFLVIPLCSNATRKDIQFELVISNSTENICYDKFFNIYDCRFISPTILNLIRPHSDSIEVELLWNFKTGDYVKKGDKLGTLKIDSLFVSKKYIAQSDGFISIETESFYNNINKNNFLIFNKNEFSQEALLYSIYPSKKIWIEDKYGTFEVIEDKDIFTQDIRLHWKVVANRYTDVNEGFNTFEMSSKNGINIYLSFEYFKEEPHLILGIKSSHIQLCSGDSFCMLLENDNNKKILELSIVDKPTKLGNSNIYKYDTLYYFTLYSEDLELLKSYFCTNWRLKFSNNRRLPIDGKNESTWTPSIISGFVLQKYVIAFCNELKQRNIEVSRHKSVSFIDENIQSIEPCFVYLMHDTTNDFYKIGISNNPGYREKTLQSEKPTIEMICCKEYPIRTIAEAFEAALHKTFADKRIRGEWFSLTQTDIMILKKTLS